MSRSSPEQLPDPATVIVVGGGPAGSFFAIRLLRRARDLGRSIRVLILEKKTGVCFYRPTAFSSWEGCNYCAGGISPRLADILHDNDIVLPEDVVESVAEEVIVHADWKSIAVPVPPDRKMQSVFRGSRPRQRPGRYENFDAFFLHVAEREGAEIVTAEVEDIHYAASGNPVVGFDSGVDSGGGVSSRSIEADFVVLAAGVNRSPGEDLASDPLYRSLAQMLPGFRPPKVRRTVIAEMQADDDLLLPLNGEVHFAQYGSKTVDIDMASLIPKQSWMTVVLLGKSIDRARPSDCLKILQEFLQVPHVRRLVPHGVELRPGCCCHPNMTVGAARNPAGSRVGLVGDMAVSRLYKDGLYSAYVTSSALADCILDAGTGQASLRRCYLPAVDRLNKDNRYGRVIFLLSRWVLGHPALSRIFYQAVLTERKGTPRSERRLVRVLWRIASGDDSYRNILRDMLHPMTMWLILRQGLVITVRNRLAEVVFGLDWTGVGRYSTGVPLEEVEEKRLEIFSVQGLQPPPRRPRVERMYRIRIRAGEEAILRQLGAFGDPDREFFKPRFITVQRVQGEPNQVGSVIRYHIPFGLSFSLVLQKVAQGRYLFYRVLDGFARDGIFAFDIDYMRPGVNLLTIYVGFDFPRGRGVFGRLGWTVMRHIFPEFAHDVVWNHSLCKIRQLAELDQS